MSLSGVGVYLDSGVEAFGSRAIFSSAVYLGLLAALAVVLSRSTVPPGSYRFRFGTQFFEKGSGFCVGERGLGCLCQGFCTET